MTEVPTAPPSAPYTPAGVRFRLRGHGPEAVTLAGPRLTWPLGGGWLRSR